MFRQYLAVPRLLLLLFVCGFIVPGRLQSQPWTAPLLISYSLDGTQFDAPSIFQDSAGVPSAIRWKNDTLICVFQWGRQPVGSPTWDRVAVKFSYNNGIEWTVPQPIIMHELPPGYQRPFDPTLVSISGDSLRVYFSSSNGIPPGADSLINTYSARSADGVNFYFEPNARVDHPTSRLIDPAVVYFGGVWHYLSPIGTPQSGAYHYVSPDGMSFEMVPSIGSDPQHNWTGNFLLQAGTELRFYGSGVPNIWFNSSANGGLWNGYTGTNMHGGDPSVVRTSDSAYVMICVGMPYLSASEPPFSAGGFTLYPSYPNPFNPATTIYFDVKTTGFVSLKVFDLLGRDVATLVQSFVPAGSHSIKWNAGDLPSGVYYCRMEAQDLVLAQKMLLLK